MSKAALIAGAAATVAICAVLYLLNERNRRLPTAEEQKWLEEQMRTPNPLVSPVNEEEQKWLDQQIKEAETADMLDDARQAAFAPGEGSSPKPKKKK